MANNKDESDFGESTDIFVTATVKIAPDEQVQKRACLVVVDGTMEHIGKQWIIDKTKITIGRLKSADCTIAEPSISKIHAQIETTGGQYHITDLGSTNGTYFENRRLPSHAARLLKDGEIFRIGGLTLKFLEQGILQETNEKARMQSELQKARGVQEHIYPSETEAQYGWANIYGYYQSATECSGDWWWHWQCGTRAFALIADTTGHGAAAALITSAARSAIATIEDDPTIGIEKVYSQLSNAIRKCSGNQLSMSAFLIEIDLNTRNMRYVNASHPPAVLINMAEKIESWKALTYISDPVSSPLGTLHEAIFVGECLAPANHRLLLVTDGLTERADADGKILSERAFSKMLIQVQEAHNASIKDFLNSLIWQSDQLAKFAPLEDDITVVAVDFK